MAVTQVKGVTVNKLTLSKYRELKQNNQLETNESYVITDIDDYTPIYKESFSTSNPIILRNLETGLYKIYGYFKYYSSYSGISGVDPFAYVIVEKGSSYSYVTVVSTNDCKRYKITDSSYEDLDDSGWITLNNYISYRKVGNQVYLRGSATTSNTLGTLPSGYRPSKNHVFLVAGSGNYYAKVRVTTAGVISILGSTGSSSTTYEIETSYLI